MKVSFRQAGGFAGLMRGCELETASMPPEEAERLSSLVGRCLEGETPAGEEGVARDGISFEIVIEGEGPPRRFAFGDLDVPPSTKPLLEYLRERSTPEQP